MLNQTITRDYECHTGEITVWYSPGMSQWARDVQHRLEFGAWELSEILDTRPPRLQALIIMKRDRDRAPREREAVYPSGLPYYTGVTNPPTLVLPDILSPVIQPRTEVTGSLIMWHELAHAFLAQEDLQRMPLWLKELTAQSSAAAIARRSGASLDEHLQLIDYRPGFTIRTFKGRASAKEQMQFQNLLLLLGSAALDKFGDEYLQGLVEALRSAPGAVSEERAVQLLAEALDTGGEAWLKSRPEF